MDKRERARQTEEYLQRWLEELEARHGHPFRSMAAWLYGQTEWTMERIENEVPTVFRLKTKGLSDFAALGAIEAQERQPMPDDQTQEEYLLSHGW